MIHDEHDVDARSMTPSRNTRSYTLRSVPLSPGRSFLTFSDHAECGSLTYNSVEGFGNAGLLEGKRAAHVFETTGRNTSLEDLFPLSVRLN